MFGILKRVFCTIGTIIVSSSITACGSNVTAEEIISTHSKSCLSLNEAVLYEHNGFKYEKTDNGINLIKYIGNERDVIIPDIINDLYVTSIDARCFSNTSNENIINSVTVPSSVDEISPMAFYNSKFLQIINCDDNRSFLSDNGVLYTADMMYLVAYPENKPDKEYRIPNTVSKIYNNAFSYCNNLESLTLSDSLEAIPDYTFAYNSSITEVVIPESVKEIGFAAFCQCPNLKKLILSNNDIIMNDEAVIYCEQLEDIEYVGDGGY